jgi:alkanesulfonate monooxygenase SsuD/methylene tetrahydromethanopterin reductase-like flavin-dependent oxidoreductase (luciferase family)
MECPVKIGLVLPMGSHSSTPEPYSFIKRFTLRAEEAGFHSVWAFEHVLFRMPGQAERGALEAWTIMSLLGEATTRIGIGSLVLGMRFRNPALLAKMAVTLDEAIGGRLTLGVSAGWHDPEYVAFGWPTDHRLGRTEEGFHVLRGLLDAERVTFDGRWVQADDAVLLPPPTRRIPLLITSRMGRMARIAARYADMWNGAWVASPADGVLVARMAEIDRACDEIGRAPAEIARTAGVSVRYDDADLPGPTGNREKDIRGDRSAVAASLVAFRDAGYSEVMVWLEPMNERSIERLAEAVERMR